MRAGITTNACFDTPVLSAAASRSEGNDGAVSSFLVLLEIQTPACNRLRYFSSAFARPMVDASRVPENMRTMRAGSVAFPQQVSVGTDMVVIHNHHGCRPDKTHGVAVRQNRRVAFTSLPLLISGGQQSRDGAPAQTSCTGSPAQTAR